MNSITVNGYGQVKHSRLARGRILEFLAGPFIDYVSGEAGRAYGTLLDTFTRRILFLKPDLIVIFDTVEAPEPATYGWHLHSPFPFRTGPDPTRVEVEGKKGAARVHFLAPGGLALARTDRFDPPPRSRVKLKEWHLTATATRPSATREFVTVILPFRKDSPPAGKYEYKYNRAGFVLKWKVSAGDAVILLRTGEGPLPLGFETDRRVAVWILDGEGKRIDAFECEEGVDEGF